MLPNKIDDSSIAAANFLPQMDGPPDVVIAPAGMVDNAWHFVALPASRRLDPALVRQRFGERTTTTVTELKALASGEVHVSAPVSPHIDAAKHADFRSLLGDAPLRLPPLPATLHDLLQ